MLETIKRYPMFFALSCTVIAVTLLILLFLNFGRERPTEVHSVNPVHEEDRVDPSAEIEIAFSGNTPTDSVSIAIDPAVDGAYEKGADGKSIRFIPQSPLDEYTRYQATLTLDGQEFITPEGVIDISYTWIFRTGQGNYGEEFLETNPTEAKQFREALKRSEDAFSERKRRLPFILQLPYTTDHFEITISALSDTVTVTTYGATRAEHLQYREEALNWIRSNGGDPRNFTLAYNPPNP